MAELTPQFSAGRAVREYTEEHYLVAASGYRERAAGESELDASLLAWRRRIALYWNAVRFGTVDTETRDGSHFFRVQIFPGNLGPDELQVQLYAVPLTEGESALQVMAAGDPGANPSARIYSAQIPATRPADDYKPRIIPSFLTI